MRNEPTTPRSPGRPRRRLKYLDGLVHRPRLSTQRHTTSLETREGDIVRVQRRDDGMWIYCLVEAILGPDALVGAVVELQSAPDLAVDGIVAGRNFVIPRDRVLSVVHDAPAR